LYLTGGVIMMMSTTKQGVTDRSCRGPRRPGVSAGRERTRIDTELAQAIQDSPVWRDKDDLLRSVPGVGPVLTTTLLANLPELGTLTNKQIAALAGVAPLNRDSGTVHGKRMVWGGRAQVRATLYMAAIGLRVHSSLLNIVLHD
jgi:transposase